MRGVAWIEVDVFRDPALSSEMKLVFVALVGYENTRDVPTVESLAASAKAQDCENADAPESRQHFDVSSRGGWVVPS